MKKKVIFTIIILLLTMLIIPFWLSTKMGIAWRIIFYFLVYPLVSFGVGIVAGTNIRKLWWIPTLILFIFPPLFWIGIGEVIIELYIFSAIYFAICMSFMLFTTLIKKIIRHNKNDKKEKIGEIEKNIKKKIICWKVAITISCILITISVLMLGYHFYRNKYVLKLNEEDRKNIKEIQIRANEHWENTVIMDLTNVDKIVWYFDFNDHVYEYYYDDGTIQTAYNDHIYELKEYIQLNGKMIGKEYFYLIILLVVFCVFATLKMLKNEDKLFFYKKDYNANIEKDINKTNL